MLSVQKDIIRYEQFSKLKLLAGRKEYYVLTKAVDVEVQLHMDSTEGMCLMLNLNTQTTPLKKYKLHCCECYLFRYSKLVYFQLDC